MRTWTASSVPLHDSAHARARRLRAVDAAVARDQLPRVIAVGPLAEQEHQLPRLARLQDAADLQRGARIQSRAGLARERRLAERGRPGEVAVAADERSALAR